MSENAQDEHARKEPAHVETAQIETAHEEHAQEGRVRKYLRWPLSYRIAHIILLSSFTILAITGLVQKYAFYGFPQTIVGLMGGIEMVRIIHRLAAIVLVVQSVVHIGESFYRLYVLRHRASMLPTMTDVRNAIQGFLYNLHLRKSRPQQGRYTFEEKFEYWALVWGTVVMALTGFVLWNPIATANLLPGEFIPAAKEVHGGEALLAVLSIIVWHMYHVHIRHFNKSMFTGYLTEEEMLEDHPLELADIKAGVAEYKVDPVRAAKRRRIFIPVFGGIAVALSIGLIYFTTFEKTAITTVPNPENVVVYAPLTSTPFPTAAPTATSEPLPTGPASAPATWDSGVGKLFKTKCGSCHGAAQTGGLNIESYTSTLAGGVSGPGIVPGDLDTSQIFIIQATGEHPVVFTEAELALIEQWILAGAPEN